MQPEGFPGLIFLAAKEVVIAVIDVDAGANKRL
jgi:hypothetical protein